MITQILILLAGLVLILVGADWLVDGASYVARKLGVSEFVIGLTIVGFGTSCPELVVSLTGALAGNADISIGNVVGSNIFNTLLILGVTSAIMPVAVTRSNKMRDVPITMIVTMALIICGMSQTLFNVGRSDSLSRVEGIVFLFVFATYLFYCFKFDEGSSPEEEEVSDKIHNVWIAVGMIVLGLAGLIFGGNLFVNGATAIAKMVGVSDKFIAVTILAGGTSLPELATCIVAAAKKKGQLALGNILGSNIFNILLILGASAVVTPLSFNGMDMVDMGMLLLSACILWLWTYTGHKDRIDRWEGGVMILLFAGYMAYLFMKL